MIYWHLPISMLAGFTNKKEVFHVKDFFYFAKCSLTILLKILVAPLPALSS